MLYFMHYIEESKHENLELIDNSNK